MWSLSFESLYISSCTSWGKKKEEWIEALEGVLKKVLK